MSPGWEDLVARVRGRSAHLLGRDRIPGIARARDLVQFIASLEDLHGSLGIPAGAQPADAELAVRRIAARHLLVLGRWGLGRLRFLTPVLLDEDRRSVRAMLRGAVAVSPAAERLAGLVPTPSLPERALRDLAAQHTPADIAARLSAWNHPFGSPLLPATRTPVPDLLRLDQLLNERYAVESVAAVRRAPRGHDTRRELVAYVSDIVDIENAMVALQFAGQQHGIAPQALFLPGGRSLPRTVFLSTATSGGVAEARALLEQAFASTPFARVFALGVRSMEDAVLSVRLRAALRDAIRFPLGAAPVIAFVLRVRAEVRDLCLIIWRLAAGAAPPAPRDLLSLT